MSNNLRILLVEDEESDVIIIKRGIAEADRNAEVLVAANGEEALAILRQEEHHESHPDIDLVFLDLNMARMNGFEFLQEAKMHPSLKPIPVIVMTSSNRDKDIEYAYRMGANSYITKPMDVDEFIKILITVIDYWKNICRLP
jgi:CheY-like chemotaxis protein